MSQITFNLLGFFCSKIIIIIISIFQTVTSMEQSKNTPLALTSLALEAYLVSSNYPCDYHSNFSLNINDCRYIGNYIIYSVEVIAERKICKGRVW